MVKHWGNNIAACPPLMIPNHSTARLYTGIIARNKFGGESRYNLLIAHNLAPCVCDLSLG